MVPQRPDVVWLSHLRWDWVFQRPNHLAAQAARNRRVFYVEEPIHAAGLDRLEVERRAGVEVIRPVLGKAAGLGDAVVVGDAALVGDAAGLGGGTGSPRRRLRRLVDQLLASQRIERPWLWFQTPMPITWALQVDASAVIYDCMDELTSFRNAPPELPEREAALLRRADVVFTGGDALFQVKRDRHPNVHPVPSAVDLAHFRRARRRQAEPLDQRPIPRPRLGWFGVIDERFDCDLVVAVATERPNWQIVLIGPVAKVSVAGLATLPNVHLLGLRDYEDLPAYAAGWDVAIMPFARNEATRLISPTKTPEYLAAGRPVVSTPINDVVHPYGDLDLVQVAEDSRAFVEACESAMAGDGRERIARADAFLAGRSWAATWAAMEALVEAAVADRSPSSTDLPVAQPPLAALAE